MLCDCVVVDCVGVCAADCCDSVVSVVGDVVAEHLVRVCGRVSKVDSVVCVLTDCVVVDSIVVVVDKNSVVAVVVNCVKGDVVVGGAACKVDAVVGVAGDGAAGDVVVVAGHIDSKVAVVGNIIEEDVVVAGHRGEVDAVVHAFFYCVVVYPGIVRFKGYAIVVV